MIGWFRRRFGKRSGAPTNGPGTKGRLQQDMAHLEEFARSREGVEGFVEPQTTVLETTLLLVATTGEWTRRRVPDPAYAHNFANKLGIPSYDASMVGIPQRMRDWNARQKAEEKAARRRALEGDDD